MNNTSIAFFIFFLLFSLKCFAFDDNDFQYWNTESLSWKANDDFKVTLEEEFRLGDDGGSFYYQHSDLGIVYSGITDWLDVGINYRHIFEKKSGDWQQENRPHLNAIVKWRSFNSSFSNRGRFEYRNRESAEDFWRYRNKLALTLPFKMTRFDIQPYIADEIFYDFDDEDLIRNRLYSGFYLKLFNNLNSEVFYLWQRSKQSGGWDDIHVLGTKLKLTF